jgi:hypothetical protein
MRPKGTLSFDESTGDVVAKRVVETEDTLWGLSVGDGARVDDVNKGGASVDDVDEDAVTSGVTEIQSREK